MRRSANGETTRAGQMRRLLWVSVLCAATSLVGPTAVASAVSAEGVVKRFVAAGIEAKDDGPMTKADWGIFGGPRGLRDARYFVIPAISDMGKSGGRVMIFRTLRALRKQKAYYDALGDEGDLFFSWTFVKKRLKVLVQINGELPRPEAMRYRAVVRDLPAWPEAAPPTARAASSRWCDQATITIGGYQYWPYGSRSLSCRTIIRRVRMFVRWNWKPKGWRCSRYTGSSGQPYGSCRRGRRYYGVSEPH